MSSSDETSFEAALAASAETAGRLEPRLAGLLQEVATELLVDADAIAAEVTRRALLQHPELHDPTDPSTTEAVVHSTRDNGGAILSMLAYGWPTESIEPLAGGRELFERLAEREDGLRVILRGYRIGMAELWQIWASWLADRVADPADRQALLAASTSRMMRAVDRISDALAGEWEATRRRRRRGLDVPPEHLVRTALFDADSDGSALRSVDYDPDLTHLAISLPTGRDEDAISQLSSRLRVSAGARSVALRQDSGWVVWLGFERPPAKDALERLMPEVVIGSPEPLGAGEPLVGLEGFRTTHRQAIDARQIGVMRRHNGVTRHRDVALLALLCADGERARALARSELGALVEETDKHAALRDTLRAYLACGESHVAAARRLNVHDKTVAYRVRRAEEILGRRIGERRVELEAALLVHEAFDGRV